jgi:hypothetical protein
VDVTPDTAGRVMRDSVPEAMPRFFENWCCKFDDILGRETQRKNFRNYLAGLLGDNHRKNIFSMAQSTVAGSYHSLHHFLHDAPWDAASVNERRLKLIGSCRQTRLKRGFNLIIDDSGHRKSGMATAGVGRQYIGQVGKVDNGIVMVTSHAYDGVKGLPLDVELYKHAASLPDGKEDAGFQKKPDIALALIDRCLKRKLDPDTVLLDGGYGNNAPLLKEIEDRGLNYVAAISKTRIVYFEMKDDTRREKHRIEDVAKTLAPEFFKPIELPLEEPRTVWVATVEVYMPKMSGKKIVAIQMDAPVFAEAKELDYYITNAKKEQAGAEWIALSYSTRNWVEVFYREAKGWLGITEYQVRDERSIHRHWILVFTAHSLIQWQMLTGGLRRWTTKAIETFPEALRAYKSAVEFLMVKWINLFPEVFAAHRSTLGLVWC